MQSSSILVRDKAISAYYSSAKSSVSFAAKPSAQSSIKCCQRSSNVRPCSALRAPLFAIEVVSLDREKVEKLAGPTWRCVCFQSQRVVNFYTFNNMQYMLFPDMTAAFTKRSLPALRRHEQCGTNIVELIYGVQEV